VSYPTAVQASAETQATPLIWTTRASAGFTIGCTVHDVPFQSSATTRSFATPPKYPTASQSVVVGHETPLMDPVGAEMAGRRDCVHTLDADADADAE
jgi:hypothetical protein